MWGCGGVAHEDLPERICTLLSPIDAVVHTFLSINTAFPIYDQDISHSTTSVTSSAIQCPIVPSALNQTSSLNTNLQAEATEEQLNNTIQE